MQELHGYYTPLDDQATTHRPYNHLATPQTLTKIIYAVHTHIEAVGFHHRVSSRRHIKQKYVMYGGCNVYFGKVSCVEQHRQ